ncbi:MAG: TraR/DksA C4-type zinc finger protein [Pirellulales bacterium]
MKCCQICGAEIPPERLEILPDAVTCVAHSGEQAGERHDPNEVCAKANVEGRKGFSPKT